MTISSGFNHWKRWFSLIFHSYVSLPEGIIPKITEKNPQFCHWKWSVQAFAPRWLWVAPWPTRRTRRSWRNAAWPRENSVSDGFGWRFPRENNAWLVVWNHGILWFNGDEWWVIMVINNKLPGWWFGTWLDYDFPFSWEWNVIIPTDELHDFSEG